MPLKREETAQNYYSHIDLMFNEYKTTCKIKNMSDTNISEAFSGGGAWDDDDEISDNIYRANGNLHKLEDVIGNDDTDFLDEDFLRLNFSNVFALECPPVSLNSSNFDPPDNYVPIKILSNGISLLESSNIKPEIYDISCRDIVDVDEQTALAALKGFMPFSDDFDKQTRYMKYLRCCIKKSEYPEISDICLDEKERQEFIMSAQIFKPSSSIITSRFESSSASFNPQTKFKAGLSIPSFEVKKSTSDSSELDRKYEKNISMSNTLFSGRISHTWIPASLLCKRFNVEQPKKDISSSVISKTARPVLADESVEKMISELVKDSKSNIKFDYSKHKESDNNSQEITVGFPENDLFDQIFGSNLPQTNPRPRAIDYFD